MKYFYDVMATDNMYTYVWLRLPPKHNFHILNVKYVTLKFETEQLKFGVEDVLLLGLHSVWFQWTALV